LNAETSGEIHSDTQNGLRMDDAELDMDWIHPWIGLSQDFEETVDWIGSDDCNPLFFSFIYFLY